MREISDNVKEKVMATIDELVPLNSIVISHMTKPFLNDVINIYLTECWQVFDKDDESTWPKTQYAPSGIPWLVIEHEGVQPRFYATLWDTIGQRWMVLPLRITHYLDPADILPEVM